MVLNTSRRERRAGFIVTAGFSVVAPKRIISPFSIPKRRVSCSALLSLCTSSTNKIFCFEKRFSPAESISLIFLVPSSAPEKEKNRIVSFEFFGKSRNN